MNPFSSPTITSRRYVLKVATAAVAGVLSPVVTASDSRPRIVASFSILADMVREIAPPQAEVTALVGPDADAHVFNPTPADGRRLAQAGLVVVNGLGFEGWIERLVKVSGYRGPVVTATQDLKPRRGGHHGEDPHAWQDLAHARLYAQNIARGVSARWPEHRAQTETRLADYLQRIAALQAQVLAWFEPVPLAERRVITGHDAFGYFAEAYSVQFLSPRAWTTSSEPSAAAVARLIRQIREQRVKALFLENISDPRLIERIAAESGARVGGTLYSDALSGPQGPASTYLKLFEHNARTLASALSAKPVRESTAGAR
jgi:zinc/manganese transport system substrate-binding protein